MVGGGLISAGVALLLAPQSEKNTRRNIVPTPEPLVGKTTKLCMSCTQGMSEFIEGIGTKANEILNNTNISDEAKRGLLTALKKDRRDRESEKKGV